ncbi:helix-turn-helix domain-containing protein, partial [Rodentibacter pneumotropicus]
YKAVGDSNKLIRGSTYFIKNGDKLEGILCINHDTSELVDTMSKLISLENLGVFVNLLGIDSAFAEMEESEIISQEKLENSVEDILSEYIDLTLLDSDKSLTLRQKENSIRVLFEKGIFNIKGAVPFVAKYLRISEPSVYRYLKNIKNEK